MTRIGVNGKLFQSDSRIIKEQLILKATIFVSIPSPSIILT